MSKGNLNKASHASTSNGLGNNRFAPLAEENSSLEEMEINEETSEPNSLQGQRSNQLVNLKPPPICVPKISQPSATALRNLIDTVTALYDSLLSIGDDKRITNAILIHLVMGKVDAGSKRKWEEQLDYTSLHLRSECESALNKRYQHMVAEEASPHFGGLWEAGVKSAKHPFLRTVGEDILTAEELGTLLTSVEAVLNSRPLEAISTDPNDGEALSPGHLLIGGPLLAPPSAALPDQVSPTCLRRWRSVSCLRHRFWQRWSREYVSSLQAKNKWHQEVPNVYVGDLVVVAEDNLPPQQWMIGRIVAVHDGADGKVRVADLPLDQPLIVQGANSRSRFDRQIVRNWGSFDLER
ncbi:uncharacterized protein LOC123037657 [Drosophila rhopaloa]|uniref:DUF5641 domain-containing protein n=1 Tax=Drosophila rhopaloa TaxID=1041015 RepID=A0ABM5J8V8_DRORH|nr:uncharacterized protein LOC123037657 [Drosophila rhopaloa]